MNEHLEVFYLDVTVINIHAYIIKTLLFNFNICINDIMFSDVNMCILF